MNTSLLTCLPTLLFILIHALLPFRAAADYDVRDSMVKIFAIQNKPDYNNPWNMLGSTPINGSGCVVAGNRILTNAHIVSDNTFIQVRLHGRPQKYKATLLAISHEADLALLTVDDASFFKGVTPLSFGGLPATQQDVLVYGFPEGGDTLSTTKGVVSRVEYQTYVHSNLQFLAIQLDAAINAGNSGGPVIVDNRIVGVVMQSMFIANDIGYIVPVPVIRHFLDDLADGRYDGFPSLGILAQNMENEGLRKKYGLSKGQSGVLVTRIIAGASAQGILKPGDVIVKIDGHEIAMDGTVEFRPKERTSLNYFINRLHINDMLNLDILRDGKPKNLLVKLTQPLGKNSLVPIEQYDVRPTYYIYGGLIFSPLTVNYLKIWGDSWFNLAPKNLVYYYTFELPEVEGEEVVTLIKVLPAEVNRGYHDSGDFRITKVNGTTIHNLRDLIRIVEEDREQPYVVFENRWGMKIVLDRNAVEAEQNNIFKTYRIPSDKSNDLL